MSNDRRSARLRHLHVIADVNGLQAELDDLEAALAELDGPIRVANGSAGAPAYSFDNDTNTGMYLVAADTLGFSINGTLRVQIDSNGKIRPTGEIWHGTLQENDERMYWALGANSGINYYKSAGTGGHVFRNGSDSERFVILTDGRIYGNALHNNANAVTGTATQYIASGTYTPTLSNISNANSLSGNAAQWLRVGNVVTVSGTFTVTPAVSTAIIIGVTLPIPSNISGNTLAGAAGLVQGTSVGAGFVFGDSGADAAQVAVTGVSVAASTVSYTFSYLVA
jgi:hypothetical protein